MFLLHDLIVDYSKVLKLARRDASSVENLDISVASVLGLGLEEPEGSDDENLSANKQEHDSATPIELIRIDEVRED